MSAAPSTAVEPGPGRGRPRRVVLLQTQAEAAGAQEISRLLARGLLARGHDVHQLFLFRRTEAFDRDPSAVICADRRPSRPADLVRMLLALYRQLRRLKPDTVICFQHYGNLIGAPVARLAGIRQILANQNGLQEILSRSVIEADRLFGRLGLFSRIVVNSSETEAEYSGHPASYRSRLVRIDHGFQEKTSRLNRTAARMSFGLDPSVTLLGCVARLHVNKQLDAAIRILPERPAWHLALAGQGEARRGLEELALALGCRERVHFVGELSPERVGDFLAALDFFVFPSRSETFGLACVEAAQAGIPVVASDLPVLRDVLQEGGQACALFADPDNTDAFRACIDRLLGDADLARTLSARGRNLRERFPLDRMIDAYEALLG